MICEKCGSKEFVRRFCEKGDYISSSSIGGYKMFDTKEFNEKKNDFFSLDKSGVSFKKDFLWLTCKECDFKQVRSTLQNFKEKVLEEIKVKITNFDNIEQNEVLIKVRKIINDNFFNCSEDELYLKVEELLK